MKKALEILKNIKGGFVHPHHIPYIQEAIAELEAQEANSCEGCVRYDHESHLLNDEQYKLRFQICHRCIRQKADLFKNKSCENCKHYIKTTNLCLKKIQNVNGFLNKDFCCNKYDPKDNA